MRPFACLIHGAVAWSALPLSMPSNVELTVCHSCIAAEDLKSPACSSFETVVLTPTCLEDVFKDISLIAAALRVPERGARLTSQLRLRLQAVEEQVGDVAKRPRVAVLEWNDPLMGSGYW